MTNSFTTVGITGAGGNIGKTLQTGLSELYQLKLYDLGPIEPVKTGQTIQVDFAEQEQVRNIFQGVDALIHLAGDPRPNAPKESTYRNNFVATSYVFEEAKKAGVKKVIFASSNFYHEGAIRDFLQGKRQKPILLSDNPTALSLYGQSKVFGENIGRHLSHFGIQFVGLRIGWTVPEDDPSLYAGAYMSAMFCSHRDLINCFKQSLLIEEPFLVAYAVSNNSRGIFDLNQTREKLHFNPQDNAENYL